LKTQIKITALSLIISILGMVLNAHASNSLGNANDINIVDVQLLNSKSITVISPANETFDYTFLKGDVSDNLILLPIEEEVTMKLVHI
jgi:hypothetical protein